MTDKQPGFNGRKNDIPVLTRYDSSVTVRPKSPRVPPPSVECTDAAFALSLSWTFLMLIYSGSQVYEVIVGKEKELRMTSTEAAVVITKKTVLLVLWGGVG